LYKLETQAGRDLGRCFVQPCVHSRVYFVLFELLEQSRLSRAISSQIFFIFNWWASFHTRNSS